MRALIIDDEASLRETTRNLLTLYCPEVEVIGQAGDVKSGVALIHQTNPELVFLDVEMPDGTGFDLIHFFPERQFAVIFITAHDVYAVRAFKFSALDYLLKPIDPDDLIRAVAKTRLNQQEGIAAVQLQALEENLQKSGIRRIVLKDAQRVYLVHTDEIIRCESQDNYTWFYLTDQRKILISTTLKEYETLLGDLSFFRSHQSHLINLIHFDHLDKREGGSVQMKDGSSVPLATRKRDQLLQALSTL